MFELLSGKSRWIVVATVALVAAGVGAYMLIGEEDSDPGEQVETEGSISTDLAIEEGQNVAEVFADGEPGVLYLSGDSLQRRDIEAQEEEDLGTLPSQDVVAADGAEALAYVVSEADEGDDGSPAKPTIYATTPGDEEGEKVGAGFSPLFHPSGEVLAYLRPVDFGACSGTNCSGDSQIVFHEVSSGEEVTLEGEGEWRFVGWAGEFLVAYQDGADTAVTLNPDGEVNELGISPGLIWGASPDGRWLLRRGSKSTFVPLEDGQVAGESIEIPLTGKDLGAGAWATDSSTLAIVRLAGGEIPSRVGLIEKVLGRKLKKNETRKTLVKKTDEELLALVEGDESDFKKLKRYLTKRNLDELEPEGVSDLVVLSPEEPEPVVVEESEGVLGGVEWSPDGDDVLFTVRAPGEDDLLQAVFCPTAAEGSCRLVMSWTSRVNILRME